MDTLKNKILAIRLREQDPDAFTEVYDLFVAKIYRFIFYKVSSVQEAEDITSEVFLKAWEYLGREETEIRNLNSFLYQIARNRVIDYYRERAKKDQVSLETLPPEQLFHIGASAATVSQAVSDELSSKQLTAYLNRLKDEYREVVVLKCIEGYSTREVARILDKKSGTVRVLLHRALKALEEIVAEEKKSALPSP